MFERTDPEFAYDKDGQPIRVGDLVWDDDDECFYEVTRLVQGEEPIGEDPIRVYLWVPSFGNGEELWTEGSNLRVVKEHSDASPVVS